METQGQNGTEPSTALATRDQLQQALAVPSPYEPTTYSQAKEMAKDFAGSKLTRVRSPEQALLIMATGRELGIPATTALRMIYVADFGNGDQVALSADLMVALCQRSPLCEYFRCVEATDEIATYVTKRKGDPERRCSFTNEDRIKARLGFNKEGKEPPDSNWAKYRRTMLMHRAASLLAREVFSDVVGGFYTADEAADMAAAAGPAPVSPLPANVTGGAQTASTIAHNPQTGEVRDAEFTEKPTDEQRIVAALEAATTAAQVGALAREAEKAWPDKATRPETVRAAWKAAKERVAKPASAPAAQEPAREREVGEEG